MTLPEAWTETTLGDVADIIMGQAPPGNACNTDGKGTPFVKAGEFGSPRPLIREWTTKPLKLARTEDILICVVGATAGKLNLGADCAIGRSVAAIRPTPATEARFLYLRLQLEVARLRSASTGTAQGVISKEMLADVAIALPPIAEQRRIVTKLDALATRIARARTELDRVPVLAARLRQATLNAFFSEQRLSQWPSYQIEDVITEGLIGLVRSKSEQSNEGIPYIRMNHYDLDGRINEKQLTCVTCSSEEFRRFEIKTGDILFNTRNSVELVGKVALWPHDRPGHVFNNNILRMRFWPEVYPEFAFRYLMSPTFRAAIEGEKSATTSVAAIYQRSLYRASIPVPPIEEQKIVAAQIDITFARADRLEAEAARARALLDRLESAILAKAFRGKLVPQDPNDEPASVLLERIRAQRASAPKPKRGRRSAGEAESTTA